MVLILTVPYLSPPGSRRSQGVLCMYSVEEDVEEKEDELEM